MPSLKQLKKSMEKQKISPEIMAQIDFETDRNNPCSFIAAIDIQITSIGRSGKYSG